MGGIFSFISLTIKIIVYLIIHIAIGVVVNNLHKSMYEKGSALSWIPFANLYLLGRLTFNETVSYILIGGIILSNIPFGKNAYGTPRKLPIAGLVLLLGTLLVIYAVLKAMKIREGKLSQKQAIENPSESFKIVINSLGNDLNKINNDNNTNNNGQNINNQQIIQEQNNNTSNVSNNNSEEDNKFKFIDKNMIDTNQENTNNESEKDKFKFIDKNLIDNGQENTNNESEKKDFKFINQDLIDKNNNQSNNNDDTSDLQKMYK